MTTHQVVTTCHGTGWAIYGRKMVLTFKRFWPASIPLVLYNDGFKPDLQTSEARELPKWLTEFKARNGDTPKRRGIDHGKPYNMLFDAVRFSHKVAAFIDAARRTTADVLIWIDADVITHSPVTEEFLDRLWLDKNAALAWLWRSHKYPETGFFMLKMNHPSTPGLLAAWETLYTQDMLFQLDHWTDCHALAAAVDRMHVPWTSLSGAFHYTGHPFVNGPLGSVMDHLKGNERKRMGRSRRIDMKFRREEAYWKGAR